MQNELLLECNVDSNKFWKSIGKIGVCYTKSKKIPLEVVLEDGSISTNVQDVLCKWENDFKLLYNNPDTDDAVQFDNEHSHNNAYVNAFNDNISILEVKKAVDEAKRGKAVGIDGIPSEVLKNDTAILFLHALFNTCFSNGTVPTVWGKSIVNPIPKSSASDPRDPMSYRGIALASAMYKLYCYVLNERLNKWVERNGILVDEQNGFRKKRSTIDQAASLYNVIDTRKKLKQSTFAAFIDFRKAYDFINRSKLWNRLCNTGINGKMLSAIKSLYSTVSASIRVNCFSTEWFDVKSGLRQGCILSPLLFNLYINDLAVFLKSLDIGVKIGDELLCILLYADDIVLLAENAADLQKLLNALRDWCNLNDMNINVSKSKIIHFRPPSCSRTNQVFTCGNDTLEIVDRYTYLGLLMHEHLDLNVMVKDVAQSASRALGLVIAKCKVMGGFPYDVFTKLYDTVVWPVISYGSAIWGYRSFSCIDAVHNRAMRFYLGVGRYTPNLALAGEMAWTPTMVRQWKTVAGFVCRLCNTAMTRVNKRIAVWASSKVRCKNWFDYVKQKFQECNITFNIMSYVCKSNVVGNIEKCIMEKYVQDWFNGINRITSNSGKGNNKLRTYCTFKSEFIVEDYCKIILPRKHMSALCKFRCGVAPIRIESGRYENLQVENRICPFCPNIVEDEKHVILKCSLYNDLRESLFSYVVKNNENFKNLPEQEQLKYLFTNPLLVRSVAKTCCKILDRRKLYLCK
ncbi:uncharacterized protein LOC128558049 [Mercenaria mercenaria]|uniref:uncharacterized protein LOC128558049 n=1 Tax=Mercenaria mercenaria TaxID=6596 RepID=UPI00234F8C1C|nr:uncharacterized protein LOC128558049 [Mercenaria mercenaria]